MATKVRFYHAGCPVCVTAEEGIVGAIDRGRFDVEVVHLGDEPSRISEAESAGVRSVPAVVIDEHVFHINHGADITALVRQV